MNLDNWKPVEKPPLGKIRDLNQEQTNRLLSFKFTALEEHDELVPIFYKIGDEINSLRKNANIPELSFHPSDVRLIHEKQWEEFVRNIHLQEDNGAFWDPLTQKCYIKYSPEKYTSSRLERITILYIIAHELGHKSLPDVEKYSFHLSEGLADFVARTSLECGVFPVVLTPEELDDKATYIQEMHPNIDGFNLRPEDIIIEKAELGAVPYSRIPQLRLVDGLRDINPEIFNRILALSYSGDYDGIKQLITQTWGQHFAERITEPKIDVKSLLLMIGEQ